MTIECTNELSSNQGTNLDVDCNQIRDKLRKKKQIVKAGSKPALKGYVNEKQRRKNEVWGDKSRKSIQ